MSFILEALNRSREAVSPVPTLSTQHPVEPVGAGLRQYLSWAVLGVAFVLVAWLLWSRLSAQSGPPPGAGSPVAELTQNIGSAAASVTTELKARAEARVQAAQLPQAPASVPVSPQAGGHQSQPAPGEVTEVAQVTAEESGVADVSPAAKAAVAVEPDAAPPATDDPAVARLYRDRTLPDPPSTADSAGTANREEQPLDIKDVLKRAQEEMGNSGLDDHPVPLLTSLSQQVKNEIPTLYYQRHDYSNNAALSEVTLNGKTVKAGGSPGSGFTVEEILPDSVVVSYRGTQFRLRALNSWVNL